MRELIHILEGYEALKHEGRDAALATVVAVEGSSYRRPGARMLVAADGRTWGTISGGCLERDVARRARMLIDQPATTQLISYETSEGDIGEEAAVPVADPGPSLGCGGRIEILLELVSADRFALLDALQSVLRERKRATLATVYRIGSAPGGCPTRVGDKCIRIGNAARASGESTDPIELALDDVSNLQNEPICNQRITLQNGGWGDLLIEHIRPPLALMIFGDGHDVGALVDLAKALAWHVTVVGSRAEAGLRAAFPKADRVVFAPREGPFEGVAIDEESAAVVMGHHLQRDAAALRELLRQPCGYIGILGPRKRTERLLTMAAASPMEPDDRLYFPIGLDIGAESPEQIALSIVAEIQAVRARRRGGSLRERSGPIHLYSVAPEKRADDTREPLPR